MSTSSLSASPSRVRSVVLFLGWGVFAWAIGLAIAVFIWSPQWKEYPNPFAAFVGSGVILWGTRNLLRREGETLAFLGSICFAFALAPALGRAEETVHKVVWQSVREDGLVATYLRPKGDVIRPAIVVVGGSEGGLKQTERLAHRFAEHGWAALALAYFGEEGLPKALANIPLEYFDAAVPWLARQPLVDVSTLAVAGSSRGGELALLLATRNPAFTRAIAWVPSHVVWGPVGPFKDATISAWTVAGRPLPFVSHLREPDYTARPYRGTPDFLADLRQTMLVEAAAIPVEKIQGGVLLLSGDDDHVWPSALMSRLAMKRLEAARHPYRFEHLQFPDAGHLIMPGADPRLTEATHPTGVVIAFGGKKDANRKAQEIGWAKALEFLRADVRRKGAETSER